MTKSEVILLIDIIFAIISTILFFVSVFVCPNFYIRIASFAIIVFIIVKNCSLKIGNHRIL